MMPPMMRAAMPQQHYMPSQSSGRPMFQTAGNMQRGSCISPRSTVQSAPAATRSHAWHSTVHPNMASFTAAPGSTMCSVRSQVRVPMAPPAPTAPMAPKQPLLVPESHRAKPSPAVAACRAAADEEYSDDDTMGTNFSFSANRKLLLTYAITYIYEQIQAPGRPLPKETSPQPASELRKSFCESHGDFPGPVAGCTTREAIADFVLYIIGNGDFDVSELLLSLYYSRKLKDLTGVNMSRETWRLIFLTTLVLTDKMLEDKPVAIKNFLQLCNTLNPSKLAFLEKRFFERVPLWVTRSQFKTWVHELSDFNKAAATVVDQTIFVKVREWWHTNGHKFETPARKTRGSKDLFSARHGCAPPPRPSNQPWQSTAVSQGLLSACSGQPLVETKSGNSRGLYSNTHEQTDGEGLSRRHPVFPKQQEQWSSRVQVGHCRQQVPEADSRLQLKTQRTDAEIELLAQSGLVPRGMSPKTSPRRSPLLGPASPKELTQLSMQLGEERSKEASQGHGQQRLPSQQSSGGGLRANSQPCVCASDVVLARGGGMRSTLPAGNGASSHQLGRHPATGAQSDMNIMSPRRLPTAVSNNAVGNHVPSSSSTFLGSGSSGVRGGQQLQQQQQRHSEQQPPQQQQPPQLQQQPQQQTPTKPSTFSEIQLTRPMTSCMSQERGRGPPEPQPQPCQHTQQRQCVGGQVTSSGHQPLPQQQPQQMQQHQPQRQSSDKHPTGQHAAAQQRMTYSSFAPNSRHTFPMPSTVPRPASAPQPAARIPVSGGQQNGPPPPVACAAAQHAVFLSRGRSSSPAGLGEGHVLLPTWQGQSALMTGRR